MWKAQEQATGYLAEARTPAWEQKLNEGVLAVFLRRLKDLEARVAELEAALRREEKASKSIPVKTLDNTGIVCIMAVEVSAMNEQPYFCCGNLPSEGHSRTCLETDLRVDDVFVLDGRRLCVQGTLRDCDAVCRDDRRRVAVRNVATNRLSYIPEWRLLKAHREAPQDGPTFYARAETWPSQPKESVNMRGIKLSNEYARAIVSYERIPKAVLAAVAYSYASRLIGDSDSPTMVESAILEEWQVLHDNGIVPQEPPK